MTEGPVVELGDPLAEDVRRIIEQHVGEMYATSPVESMHALGPAALAVAGTTFYVARISGLAVGCGALKQIASGQAEIKSMRTVTTVRGQGVGNAILTRIMDDARELGIGVVYLETGIEDFFAPARQFYAKFGFTERGPFADYRPDPNSVFMERKLP